MDILGYMFRARRIRLTRKYQLHRAQAQVIMLREKIKHWSNVEDCWRDNWHDAETEYDQDIAASGISDAEQQLATLHAEYDDLRDQIETDDIAPWV